MTGDEAAFEIHLDAFDKLCEQYMSAKRSDDAEAIMIDERIKGYRRG